MSQRQVKKARREARTHNQPDKPIQYSLEKKEREELIFLNFQEKFFRLQSQSINFAKYQLNESIKQRLGLKDDQDFTYTLSVTDLMDGIVEVVKLPTPKPLPKEDNKDQLKADLETAVEK